MNSSLSYKTKMTRASYTAVHWGIYEVRASAPGSEGDARGPELRPFARDPDPSPIGLDQLHPSVTRLRIRPPAVRRSWLERGPRTVNEGRGHGPFVELDWVTATSLVARELARVRAEHGNRAIFGATLSSN